MYAVIQDQEQYLLYTKSKEDNLILEKSPNGRLYSSTAASQAWNYRYSGEEMNLRHLKQTDLLVHCQRCASPDKVTEIAERSRLPTTASRAWELPLVRCRLMRQTSWAIFDNSNTTTNTGSKERNSFDETNHIVSRLQQATMASSRGQHPRGRDFQLVQEGNHKI